MTEKIPTGQCMNILAINSSPHKDMGNTALILNPFLKGMKEAGADVSVVYTEDLTIQPCRGDLTCFCRPSGKCIQSDDMDWLMPMVRNADVLVFASPLYIDGVNGPMKTLLDRIVPLSQLIMEIRDDHCRHPLKDGKKRRIILVSNCGFWERDNFDALIQHIRAISKNLNAEFSGALIRPHGTLLKNAVRLGLQYEDILEAAERAGHQVVENGKITDETLEAVCRDMLTRDKFMELITPLLANATKRLGREVSS